MPKVVVHLSEHANRIVDAAKAREGMKRKSEAIEHIIEQYEELLLDPALKPGFAAALERIRQGHFEDVNRLVDVL
jgi:hypothetical protein